MSDGESLPREWLADFDRSARGLARSLSSRLLLVNLWGKFSSRGEAENWIAVSGSQGRYGHSDPDADRWPQLKTYLLNHPAIRPKWEWLVAEGFEPRFVESSDYSTHTLNLVLAVNDRSLAAVRELAKREAGAHTPDQSKDFDARFDLYLKQNWIRDDAERNGWREREPLAIWPWRPPGRKHFVLTYKLAADYLERRPAFRDAHLALARAAADRGELLLGGALDDAEEAVLLFAGEDHTAAEAFARNDPYVKERLVDEWRVREWVTVVGEGPALRAD